MKIGIYGAGQLAQMMAEAALKLGFSVCFFVDPEEDTRCVTHLGPIFPVTPSEPTQALKAAGHVDLITLEREQVNLQTLKSWERQVTIFPSAEAIATTQNRIKEKRMLDDLALPTAPWVSTETQVETWNERVGFPAVLKHPTQGYDGKSQWRVSSAAEVTQITARLEQALMLEAFVPFDFEVSIISARSREGEFMFYPPSANRHIEGILLNSIAPAPLLSDSLTDQLCHIARTIMEHLDYTGVMAIECFVTGDQILINEIAPRVHNSGHWTMHHQVCSQFEQHMRAIAGLPLRPFESKFSHGLVNLLGPFDAPPNDPGSGSELIWYGKTSKPRRKLGHIVQCQNTETDLIAEQEALINQLYFCNPKSPFYKPLPGGHVVDERLTQTL
jgi:5-(carboxyamino)imidazole ribonucleotide synthase